MAPGLVGRREEERTALLARAGVAPDEWSRADGYWTVTLAGECARGERARAEDFGRACAGGAGESEEGRFDSGRRHMARGDRPPRACCGGDVGGGGLSGGGRVRVAPGGSRAHRPGFARDPRGATRSCAPPGGACPRAPRRSRRPDVLACRGGAGSARGVAFGDRFAFPVDPGVAHRRDHGTPPFRARRRPWGDALHRGGRTGACPGAVAAPLLPPSGLTLDLSGVGLPRAVSPASAPPASPTPSPPSGALPVSESPGRDRRTDAGTIALDPAALDSCLAGSLRNKPSRAPPR